MKDIIKEDKCKYCLLEMQDVLRNAIVVIELECKEIKKFLKSKEEKIYKGRVK